MADLAEAKKEDFDSKPPDKQAQSLTAQIATTKRKLAKKEKETKGWGEQALHAHQQFLEGSEEVERLQEELEALQARLAMSVATQAAAVQPAPAAAAPAPNNIMDLIGQMQSLLTSLVPPVTDEAGQPTQEVVDCRAWINDLGTKATAIVGAKARHDMQKQDKKDDEQQSATPKVNAADHEMDEDVESEAKKLDNQPPFA